MIVHAGLIARPVAGFWRGALITGPSGAGKSDLALRLLDEGFVLVADDRTRLWSSGGRLFGRAPQTLLGMIEARGLGIMPVPTRDFAEVALVVECVAGPIERLPDPETSPKLGHELPLLRLVAHEASAPAKLAYALMTLG